MSEEFIEIGEVYSDIAWGGWHVAATGPWNSLIGAKVYIKRAPESVSPEETEASKDRAYAMIAQAESDALGESELKQCWACLQLHTIGQYRDADGFCPNCDVEVET